MADLTINEIGKVLQLNLINIDQTVSPPASGALDLTNADVVNLIYAITPPGTVPPTSNLTTKSMTILNPRTNGIVQYTFAQGDLVAPKNMGKEGLFKYTVQVHFPGGNQLYAALDGKLSIKDDSIL